MYTLDPSIFLALKGFFSYHASFKSNADLQLLTFNDAGLTNANGVVVADAPCVVYVAYVKKTATDTDAYFKVFDNATNDATTTDLRATLAMLETGEEQLAIYPKGLTMAVGVDVASHTNGQGATQSAVGDSGNGFLIIGASGAN